ncbi:hypothetical protein [Halomontanus rarus]|uniref:hypothetical protein n=1 Tax=Halomontanus rarus TaxID=3034020 RepID=UPI001A99596C
MSGFDGFLGKFLYAVFVAAVVAVVLNSIANSGLAPQPGDPFFPAWTDVTQYGWQALLWVIPGVGAAAYAVLRLTNGSGGF